LSDATSRKGEPKAMAKSVRVIAQETLADGRFRLIRTRAEVEEADGARRVLDYEIYHHGPAAAVLLYDPARRVVMLVRQFRLAAYLADGTAEMLEACAGMLDDDDPETCARREASEETGVRIAAAARHAFDAFTSPGALTEKISCFVAPYSASDRVGAGGGVDADEHIDVVEVGYEEAEAMIASGAIRDAKTIALICYAKATGLFG
jgi:nudix-type nucleoside diphosphatase (YffH/AdpP family)